eukprot:GHVO01026737.1.p1 GENE.GHVO01026737.1~~GHVO01026737.1.p1  ORF type:complete len:148 (-),score=25.41 GHVO01026737.1:96-539(-)
MIASGAQMAYPEVGERERLVVLKRRFINDHYRRELAIIKTSVTAAALEAARAIRLFPEYESQPGVPNVSQNAQEAHVSQCAQEVNACIKDVNRPVRKYKLMLGLRKSDNHLVYVYGKRLGLRTISCKIPKGVSLRVKVPSLLSLNQH